MNNELETLAKGGVVNQDLTMPFIIDRTNYIPNQFYEPMTTKELVDAINKCINDNPVNNPKEFEALATFNAGSISRTRGAE